MKNELALPPGFNLRLVQAGDEPFLQYLFCSARPELSLLPLPQEQLASLIRQQYEWQQKSYASQYPNATCWVIEVDSEAVGKIMFVHSDAGVHIVDFIIAAASRGRGIGSTILTAFQNHVDIGNTSLSLSVDRQNIRAKQLYQRLGFSLSQSTGTHEQMIWFSSRK